MEASSRRVLILEDEPSHAEGIRRAFKISRPGDEVLVAGTLEQYRAAIADTAPDIVIMDMKLPDGTALEALTAPPEAAPFPVVVMTSYGNETVAVQAMKAGAIDYVVKSPEAFAGMPRTAERALREWGLRLEMQHAEQQWASTFEAINDAIWLIDPDGRIIKHNKASERLFALSPDRLVGRLCYEVACAAAQLPEGYPFVRMRQTLHRETGTIARGGRWLEITVDPILDTAGRLTGAVHIIADITARRQAEDTRIRLVNAVEQVRDTVMIMDPDGTIHYVNRALEELTGQSRQELNGCNILAMGNTSDEFKRAWKIAAAGDLWSGSLAQHNKNGAVCELELTLTPVRNEQGILHSIVAMGRDVTREKQIELRLAQAQKMEAIGTLAGGIAHDFNNILTAAIGYTELSLSLAPEGSELAENLREILVAGFRARDLVKQILTFSRQSAQDKKPVRFASIVQEALHLLRATLPATIEIQQDMRSTSVVLADPTQIHQIIMNLCTNAAHAMKEKGGALTITVTDENLDSDFTESHQGAAPGRYLKFSLSDTGCGMSRELIDRIFDPFFTTKDKAEGTGLGLAVVHGIVQDCGGIITVSSEPAAGSTFTVFFPLIKGMAETGEIPLRREPFPAGTEHVLLVDDEESIVSLQRQVLEKLGYRVDTSCSALEALELFRRQKVRVDLVITDMTMPKMRGDMLAREIHRLRPEVPVILMSGYGLVFSQDDLENIGVKAVLTKPATMQTMTETVRKVLDEAGRSPEP